MTKAGDRPVALVTGAAGGLGTAIAHALARGGFDLILNDLTESDALLGVCKSVREQGVRAAPLAQDIAKIEALDEFAARAAETFGRLDCLVNNAGVSVLSRGDILDVSPESFDRCVAVMMRGTFFLTQRLARRMMGDGAQRKKSIITITSVVATDHLLAKDLAEYCMTKTALANMVKHFAVRLAPLGIDCYEVRPGMMRTAMTGAAQSKYDALIADGFVPAQRWGELEDVGRAVATLAGGGLSFATGQTISVDGGLALKVF